MNNMQNLWKTFELQLLKKDKNANNWFNPPANYEHILLLEQAIHTPLPKEFIDYLQIHNGQSEEAEYLFDNTELLTCEDILRNWRVLQELFDGGDFDDATAMPDKNIKPYWWNPKWVPFSHNGFGDYYCIDLDPTKQGVYGQVITFWHDDGARTVKANSLSDWFKGFVETSEA